jgi:hypothetical protein
LAFAILVLDNIMKEYNIGHVKMKYKLIKRKHHVEISHECFETLKSNKKFLIEALFIEEKYNLVVENHSEFELELLGNKVRNMLFHDHDWSSAMSEMHLINRRIVNLLTTCRLYLDQVQHHLQNIYRSESEQVKEFKVQSSHEYDSSFGYRVMEAMRNYVQHRGLSIGQISNQSQLVENEDQEKRKHTIKLFIDVAAIEQDGKFKQSVLAELKDKGDTVEFIPLIRQYIESIGRIHLKVRELIEVDLLKADDNLLQAINLYEESKNDILLAPVKAVALSIDSSTCIESFVIFDDFIERRKMLERKNNHPNYSHHFVSSEAPEL